MLLEQRLLQPFTKAKYLSEGNYKRYTAIIHFLYQQHEIYYAPPALASLILENIRANDFTDMFEEYTVKEVEQDLSQLEEWGNVVSHQDTGFVKKISDFNNRKLRYQCTPETIRIERLLESLNSQISRVSNSLDPNRIHSLSSLILKLESHKGKTNFSKEDRVELSQLWKNIFEQFDRLREESSDYLALIQSRNIDEAMKNREISAFRVKFTEYLTSFIIALQKNIYVIEYGLKAINQELIHSIFNALIEHQKDIPTFEDELNDEELLKIFTNQWNGLNKWFTYEEGNERYIDFLLKQTNETISTFTNYLQRINERGQNVKNRKRLYEHMARLFKEEADMDACFRSFGAMTNVEKPLHFFSEKNRTVKSEYDLHEHPPELKEVSARKVQERKAKRVMVSVEATQEDLEEMNRLQQERLEEEAAILELVNRGNVRIKELREVKPFVRGAILHWLSQATDAEENLGKTEHGIDYKVKLMSEEMIIMQCIDGELTMPDYLLAFKEVG